MLSRAVAVLVLMVRMDLDPMVVMEDRLQMLEHYHWMVSSVHCSHLSHQLIMTQLPLEHRVVELFLVQRVFIIETKV